jgi:hypothetical protein
MGFWDDPLGEFWANIQGGATTIATAPDPITNIATSEPKNPIQVLVSPTKAQTTKMYQLYGQVLPLTPSAVDYYLSKGIVPEPVVNKPKNTAFETLYPKQTQQLIKMGKDMTKMGKDATDLGVIVTRQDITDISHQEQINEAYKHRQILETRSQKAIDERADIHAKLIQLGQHKHDGTSDGIPWYVMIVGVLAGALVIYMLLKKGIFG